MSGLKTTIVKTQGGNTLMKRIEAMTKPAAYVGIPTSTSKQRSDQLTKMAGKGTSARARKLIRAAVKAAKKDINNAELLFIFSKGSPANRQPARPVLEPSVMAEGNREPIARELAGAVKSGLDGDNQGVVRGLRRTALAAQNAARGWFTDPRNGWPQNAPSTIRRKSGYSVFGPVGLVGQDRSIDAINTPGIDTGAMRAAIQGIVAEE